MPVLRGSRDIDRELRWRDAADAAPELGRNKRARAATAVGHIKFRIAEPACRHTSECCVY